MTGRRSLLWACAVVLVFAAAAYAFQAPLSVALAQRFATSRMASDPMAELPDGLHLGICGAGSPFPDEKRSAPCSLVLAGKRLFVFDAGAGSARNIGRMGFNHGRIEAVFLTHFHSDHIDGLGELMLQRWVSVGNKTPLPLFGPEGVEQVLSGFMLAYTQDRGHRVAHHGDATVPASGFGGLPRPFAMVADGRAVLFKEADLEIVAFMVDHAPARPAVGYRISYKGRSLVLSGDTRKSGAVLREATGVDLLVHEALSSPLLAVLKEGAAKAGRTNLLKIFDDILDYHASPEQAAETARDAKVRFLLLNHIVPPLPVPGMEQAFLGNAPGLYDGPIRVGLDGDFVSLLPGSTQVTLSRRF
jgi:ribonuclease Z